MAFPDTAARKLLHGGSNAIARGVAAEAVGTSFGLDGLWQLIAGLFANIVAALGGAAHELAPAFEKLWRWLQTAAASYALPVAIGLVALVSVWFCGPSLCAAALGIGRALAHVVCYCGRCLYAVPSCAWGCVAVIMRTLARAACCCGHVVTMRAPGAAGNVISRAAFAANPQLYFQILHSAGGAAAAAVFR